MTAILYRVSVVHPDYVGEHRWLEVLVLTHAAEGVSPTFDAMDAIKRALPRGAGIDWISVVELVGKLPRAWVVVPPAL